jgi:osmotically-inducible protein OsmY
VINELVVKSKDFTQYAKESLVANAIRSKLLVEKFVSSTNYKVDVNHGVAYILGVAHDNQEKNKVLEIARTTSGVHSVVSHIILRTDSRRRN